MGGTQSTSTSETVNNMATNVATKHIMKCATMATQDQMISVETSGNIIGNTYNQKQGMSVDMDCVMKVTTQQEIVNDVSSALAQYTASKGDAVLSLLGGSESSANNIIRNNLVTNISNTTGQEMINQMKQKQQATYVGRSMVMNDVNQEQSAEITAKALMETEEYSKVLNAVSNAVDQKTEATTTNPIGSIVDSFASAVSTPMLIFVGGGVALVVLLAIVWKFSGKNKKN